MSAPPAVEVPPVLARNAGAVWGDAGRRWLADLPGTVAALLAEWELVREPAAYPLSFHWVGAVRTGAGLPAVLKVGLPGAEHLAAEAAALSGWQGRGAVRLVRFDPARGALLLERAEPGTPVADLVGQAPDGDERATAAAVEVLRRLHAGAPPADGRLEQLPERLRALDVHLTQPWRDRLMPRHLVDRARGVARELLVGAPAPRLLHGDLHHDNVLRAAREPHLAIDPHGVVGDPAYDTGAWLYNPAPDVRDDALVALVPARVEQLADGLGLPLDRVVAWGFVQAVLSASWTCDTREAPDDRTLDVAALLAPRLP